MAQNHDLKLPLTAAASEHANEPAQEPVQQTHRHTAQSEPAPLRSPTRPTWQESSFFTSHGIGKPTAAHIHKAPAGTAGPVVVPFGATYKAKNCQTATKALIDAIESNPNAYYVNVHTAKYPNGAIRGQLVAGMMHM